ncbi:helix-turn-helix transcriptional regulator [Lutibaculum baratangense]|uniref:Putative transcriptional regulator protein, LuxR family protein n=1 Tax=Lutibaculum baratangense AMV1 TaxID=631454 RepID=V4T928_9HYPH|nr:response regulator transcription factor [Lutibaculum baratangense]ESR23043.1 putative transcriptional regulator protein, LuxR family protein [Lutibaculum baratangense AMV1]
MKPNRDYHAPRGLSQRQGTRTILIISGTISLAAELGPCIERKFEWTRVVEVTSFEAAFAIFPDPVALILIDAELLADVTKYGAQLARMHPLSRIAVLGGRVGEPGVDLVQIADEGVLAGWIPDHARIDLTLSIIQLILQGGEYYPREFFARLRQAPPPKQAASSPSSEGRVDAGVECYNLSKREREIIALASEGLQNKIIACRLSISENTVKIHMHNIITKLGVYNRTGAAARYREAASALRERGHI